MASWDQLQARGLEKEGSDRTSMLYCKLVLEVAEPEATLPP